MTSAMVIPRSRSERASNLKAIRSIPPGLDQIVNVFAESAVGQNTLEFLPRDRL